MLINFSVIVAVVYIAKASIIHMHALSSFNKVCTKWEKFYFYDKQQ